MSLAGCELAYVQAPACGIRAVGLEAIDAAAVDDHEPGNNIFSYYVDPNGCVVETSFGMERIDNDSLHQAGVWDSDYDKRVLDLWGSKPPANYAAMLTRPSPRSRLAADRPWAGA